MKGVYSIENNFGGASRLRVVEKLILEPIAKPWELSLTAVCMPTYVF